MRNYFNQEIKRFKDLCCKCGLCIDECPVLDKSTLGNMPSSRVMSQVRDFLNGGELTEAVAKKATLCMGCFKCVHGSCPQGLSAMLVNQVIKKRIGERSGEILMKNDPACPTAHQRILSSIQVGSEDYARIFTEKKSDIPRFVFFPGCNVYNQPGFILNALDILSMITDDYSFLPGLSNCCGFGYQNSGDMDKAFEASLSLVEKLSEFNASTVVFWCPTCLCHFETFLNRAIDVPFTYLSFPMFIAKYGQNLPFSEMPLHMTLHEACKATYTSSDTEGPYQVLSMIPGIKMTRMKRSGKNTVCCGSGVSAADRDIFLRLLDSRLTEARGTGADTLVDVCHFCHYLFSEKAYDYGLDLRNIVSIVGESLGIKREDHLKKYRQWNDFERIMKDIEKFIVSSPFSEEEITSVIKRMVLHE